MRMTASFLGLVAWAVGSAMAADPASIDWAKIPGSNVKLFYPGQASYQWLRTPEHKKGDKQVAQGRSCLSCHEGDEADIGNKLVQGGPLEATPVPGKRGTLDLAVQAAHDDRNLYLRFRWKTQATVPGDAYPQLRFDGKEWKKFGAPRLAQEVREGKTQAIYEDRLSILLDDGKVSGFQQQGCWLTCHDGMRQMRNEATNEQLAANPLLHKRSDVRKYLPSTRSDSNASWDKTKSADAIAKVKEAGGFLELMQWRAHRSNPAGMADDGYVLEYRLFDAGKNAFSSNEDPNNKLPKMMFDAAKVGYRALTAADIGKLGRAQVLVKGENAVPFDPKAGWKEGEMLPQYVVSRADASGSAADNANVKGVWENGTWTVVWVRPLNLANPDDKALKVGGVYPIGIAVHDDNITARGHHVSFPLKLGIGVKADIFALTLK